MCYFGMLTAILDHLGQYLTSSQRRSVRAAFDETCAPAALRISTHCTHLHTALPGLSSRRHTPAHF